MRKELTFNDLPSIIGQLIEINQTLLSKVDDLTERLNNETSANQKPILTRDETARFFGVHPNTIDNWVNNGLLNKLEVGRRTYFDRQECLNLLYRNVA